jgi:hypothetical protein
MHSIEIKSDNLQYSKLINSSLSFKCFQTRLQGILFIAFLVLIEITLITSCILLFQYQPCIDSISYTWRIIIVIIFSLLSLAFINCNRVRFQIINSVSKITRQVQSDIYGLYIKTRSNTCHPALYAMYKYKIKHVKEIRMIKYEDEQTHELPISPSDETYTITDRRSNVTGIKSIYGFSTCHVLEYLNLPFPNEIFKLIIFYMDDHYFLTSLCTYMISNTWSPLVNLKQLKDAKEFFNTDSKIKPWKSTVPENWNQVFMWYFHENGKRHYNEDNAKKLAESLKIPFIEHLYQNSTEFVRDEKGLLIIQNGKAQTMSYRKLLSCKLGSSCLCKKITQWNNEFQF